MNKSFASHMLILSFWLSLLVVMATRVSKAKFDGMSQGHDMTGASPYLSVLLSFTAECSSHPRRVRVQWDRGNPILCCCRISKAKGATIWISIIGAAFMHILCPPRFFMKGLGCRASCGYLWSWGGRRSGCYPWTCRTRCHAVIWCWWVAEELDQGIRVEKKTAYTMLVKYSASAFVCIKHY